MNYPRWKYHATKPAVIVHSAEEENELGKGWGENPVEVEPLEEVSEAVEESKDEDHHAAPKKSARHSRSKD